MSARGHPCGSCDWCLQGDFKHCASWRPSPDWRAIADELAAALNETHTALARHLVANGIGLVEARTELVSARAVLAKYEAARKQS
jgi:hypothetical protein